MTSTPASSQGEPLVDSWEDVSGLNLGELISMEMNQNGDMKRLLREAQRNLSQASSRISGELSHRESPKSPPNSPEVPLARPNGPASLPDDDDELLMEEDIREFYINPNRDNVVEFDRDYWLIEWSSRPDQQPPKEFNFQHPASKTSCLSMRHSKVLKRGLFSAEFFSILMITNLVSLLLGAGIGFCIGKRLGSDVVSSLD